MKNKLKGSIFFVISIIFIAVPQIALASWWNPFSWFKKEVKVEQIYVSPKLEVPQILEIKKNESKKEVIKTNPVPLPVETKKIVVESIKVTEPIKEPQPDVQSPAVPLKENYKLEDVVKKWRPYVVRVTCIMLNSQGEKSKYSDGSGFLVNIPSKGPSILTNSHVFSASGKISTNYCDIQFPDNSEVLRVERKDRYFSKEGYDKGILVISQPSEYVTNLIDNAKRTLRDCIYTKPESTDDIVIFGYPKDKPKNDISVSQGKIVGYMGNFFITSATMVEGYSGGVAVSLKDNCYLGIPTYQMKDDPTKSLILDVNKF